MDPKIYPASNNNRIKAAKLKMPLEFLNSLQYAGLPSKKGKNWNSLITDLLKPYFQVSTEFVVKKAGILIFPYLHKQWKRRKIHGAEQSVIVMEGYDDKEEDFKFNEPKLEPAYYCVPKEDINAPDLYIPCMSYMTLLVVAGIKMGLNGKFHSDILGIVSSTVLFKGFFQLIFLYGGGYLFKIGRNQKILDMVSLVGYSNFATTIGMIVNLIYPKLLKYTAIWMSFSLVYFLGSYVNGWEKENRIKSIQFFGTIGIIQLIGEFLLAAELK